MEGTKTDGRLHFPLDSLELALAGCARTGTNILAHKRCQARADSRCYDVEAGAMVQTTTEEKKKATAPNGRHDAADATRAYAPETERTNIGRREGAMQ